MLMKQRHWRRRPLGSTPVVKRTHRTPRPPKRRAVKSVAPDRDSELVTVLDLVRYAVTRFAEAKLVFAHGTTDPVAEAAFIVGRSAAPAARSLRMVRAGAGDRSPNARASSASSKRASRPASRLPISLGRIYAAGVAFHVDERVIVPRSYLGELLAGDLFSDGEEEASTGRTPTTSRACSISAPDRARSRCSLRCAFLMPPSMPSTFRRMPSRSRRATSASMGSANASPSCAAISSRRSSASDTISSSAIRPMSTPRAWPRCRRNAGTSRRSRSTAAATASTSSRASSKRRPTPHRRRRLAVRGRARPAGARSAVSATAVPVARHRGEQRRGVLARCRRPSLSGNAGVISSRQNTDDPWEVLR